MRIGMYAVYRGKEYQAAKTADQYYKLIGYYAHPPFGFRKSEFEPQAYIKIVQRVDLDAVYLIKTYADYRGERLEVAAVKDDAIVLATSDALVAQRVGLQKIDRCDFRLEVKKDEVTRFIEVKEPLVDPPTEVQ